MLLCRRFEMPFDRRQGHMMARKNTHMKKAWDAARTEQTARSFLESACYLVELGEAKQSLSLFKRTASMGSIEAQVNLGVALAFGSGTKIDLKESRKWLKRAVDQGSSHAAYNLGVVYRKHREPRWARYWFQRALELGDDDAQEDLNQLTPMLAVASTSARPRRKR